jgi:hypothetical protein
MGDFPVSRRVIAPGFVGIPAFGTGVEVTVTSGSAGVAGAWIELVASTSEDLLIVGGWTRVSDNDAATYRALQLGIGAGGSEVVLSILLRESATGATEAHSRQFLLPFPVYVPSGSRLSAKLIAVNGSDTLTLSLMAINPSSFAEEV